ncbi:MAG: T9SS type A sorting domain-containing protein, partial [Chitinophagales bacterium]
IVGYNYSPYNLGTSNPNKRNYHIQHTSKFAMNLLSNINGQSLKYMKLGIGTYSHNPNLPPTIFIDPVYENLYIYYTNVKGTTQNYIIEDGSLRLLYSGATGIILDVATITCIDAAMPYSASGKDFLYDVNACYSALNPYDIEINETIMYINSPDCTGSIPDYHCITVPAYSSGYIKIPVTPDFTPAKLASISEPAFLYPNPATGDISIANAYFTEFVITDITGSVLESGINNNNHIDIEQLPSGYFILQYKNNEETVAYYSFIKN